MKDWLSRTELLIGRAGLDRLARARVAVFGLGGVGSYAAEALARCGVGHFTLVDFDRVCPSNINRQLHALTTTVGQPKAALMGERIRLINPQAQVEVREERYLSGAGDCFLLPPPDCVVDAIDDVPAKVDLIASCRRRGIAVYSSMGAGNKLDPGALKLADISATSVCPLARAVRRRLRREGITGGVTVVFSTEPPRRENCGEVERRVSGSVSFVPSVAGLLLAGAAVRGLLAVFPVK
ncbi:tRNA threonylcarbamoyladenosine dehydratase [Desulfotomaculum copahuensis]|uniref:tRNA cyclic N6-threonylcarbamoyladenosine(37) synthase TcdA n=1 Tax=Desulfotomaculum copahuensis TaxID=1838280 RepID=A0A1B7LGE8_9FIRM|nr:tRNA threonylcarbamoyladenosine dehydratase [Desulfotomaculum copahuensis]OAT85006.1 tRNA cyclic N6-threonylcarbamoyladenosine(37) synthase TcdA [Desulfotomaculum copahuensis]